MVSAKMEKKKKADSDSVQDIGLYIQENVIFPFELYRRIISRV